MAREDGAYVDRRVVRPFDDPITPQGGLVALFGNLAPRGAILKRSAADPSLFEGEGQAVVFSSLDDLAARIDDPDLDVGPQTTWSCKTPGPACRRPCPRPAICRSRARRCRGQGHGAHFRRPYERHRLWHHCLACRARRRQRRGLGLVRDGDRIRLSVAERRLELLVDDVELKRWAAAGPSIIPARRAAALLRHHLQADEGCDFSFLKAPR